MKCCLMVGGFGSTKMAYLNPGGKGKVHQLEKPRDELLNWEQAVLGRGRQL